MQLGSVRQRQRHNPLAYMMYIYSILSLQCIIGRFSNTAGFGCFVSGGRLWVFSIYKKFRKISIGNSGNFRLGKERSICHKSHSFTSPSPSLHQKTRCVGKLFCYFRERVFFRRFPVKQMLIIGMCGYEKSDICMFPSF